MNQSESGIWIIELFQINISKLPNITTVQNLQLWRIKSRKGIRRSDATRVVNAIQGLSTKIKFIFCTESLRCSFYFCVSVFDDSLCSQQHILNCKNVQFHIIVETDTWNDSESYICIIQILVLLYLLIFCLNKLQTLVSRQQKEVKLDNLTFN